MTKMKDLESQVKSQRKLNGLDSNREFSNRNLSTGVAYSASTLLGLGVAGAAYMLDPNGGIVSSSIATMGLTFALLNLDNVARCFHRYAKNENNTL